ncbi:RDD family protein [Brachybacterium sp. YJGR34]|uniref:RDD family protein n=1 Tax=Brachybacterium sp. YJGR34 TaxID=2059911 RepID=UPI000E0B3BD3|nr:RDD family protein [Brachybacterium sp. YJGR34]
MNQTRYCSTCGSLLSEAAAICGECGARYQPSPYERRATDAPGAWSQAPGARSRDLGAPPETAEQEDGIELITRESLDPDLPGATALRTPEQYDQMMVTQPPMNQPGTGSAPSMGSGPASPPPAPSSAAPGQPGAGPVAPGTMAAPLDGCLPAPLLKRVLAAVVDSVLSSLVMLPMMIGFILILTSEEIGLLPQILVGVGAALPAAYHLVIIWLTGAKGFTLGSLILGLRITRESSGGPIGFLRALGRYVLYGLIPLIMALSVFVDPKKILRGLHDRAVDAVVVDARDGRNPMTPRPDDFERAGAEHYLGAPSVAVSTHENLLAQPGAAWSGGQSADTSGGPTGAPPAQSAEQTGWGGAPQGAPSSYAPPTPQPSQDTGLGGAWSAAPAQEASVPEAAPAPPDHAPQQDAGGWAPPSTDPVPSAPPQQSWDPSAAQPGWAPSAPPPAAPPVDQPAPPSPAPQQSWGPSAPDQPAPPQQQSWAPSPEAPAPTSETAGWSGPAAPAAETPTADAPGSSWAPPAPAPDAERAPGEITGDAWGADDGHDVDEQTRLTAVDEPMEDLEQTRLSAVRRPAVRAARLITDDGVERRVERPVVIGRNPSAAGPEELIVLKDSTRSVSKTHLRLDATGDEVVVTDLGSTNGSSILHEDGSREDLEPDAPTVLPAGAQVTLGDRILSVEREK